MSKQYVDYDHFQYYHQKLKLDFDSIRLPDYNVENLCNLYLDSSYEENTDTLIDKTMNIPSNGFLRVRLGAGYTGSGTSALSPVEWHINDLAIRSNNDYAYKAAVNTRNAYIAGGEYSPGYTTSNLPLQGQIDGLAIELLCRDENNALQYYSTIGKMPVSGSSADFSESPYKIWEGMTYSNEQYFDSLFWNFIALDFSLGEAKTYCLNYHTDSSNLTNGVPTDNTMGTYFNSDEFQITLIHDTIETYSVIFYWKCVE